MMQPETRTNAETAYKARTTSYVYFIACDGHVKIGHATNVQKRLMQLQSGSPHRLDLLGTVDGGKAEEAALHKRFRRLRVGGEWFALRPPLSDFIIRLSLGLPLDGDLIVSLMNRMGANTNPVQD